MALTLDPPSGMDWLNGLHDVFSSHGTLSFVIFYVIWKAHNKYIFNDKDNNMLQLGGQITALQVP